MSKDEIWIIAYINRDFIKIAEDEMNRYHEFGDVEVYIPTIKILKKKAKGKNIFESLPLLFNYGFFKMPYHKATSKEFLLEMRHRISCIYGWVRDPSKTIRTRPVLNVDNHGGRQALPAAAVATDEEITRMVAVSENMSIYDKSNMESIEVGKFITLEGYPFEGITAKVLDINHSKKEVKVELQLEPIFREVKVSFDNVFYTVYKGFENRGREKSLEEMGDINMIDNLTFKNRQYEE